MLKGHLSPFTKLCVQAVILVAAVSFLLVAPALAKDTHPSKVKTASAQAAFKKLKPQIEKGYKELQALYKKRAHGAFSKKLEDLKVKLSQPVVPARYRKSMLRKALELSDRMDEDYFNERAARDSKKDQALRKLGTRDSKKPRTVRYSDDPAEDRALKDFKQGHDDQGQRIREQILKEQPVYRQDHDGLEDAIVERKVKIVRQREFLMTEFEKGVEAQYQTGVRLFNQKEYARSQDSFSGLEKMAPNYKDTRTYLKKLKKLSRSSPRTTAPKVVAAKKPSPRAVTPKVKKVPPPPEQERDQAIAEALEHFEREYAGEKREQ